MCASLAKLMITEFDPANTVAVRTYCLCPRGNGSNLCFNEDELQKNLQGLLEGKRMGPPPGSCCSTHRSADEGNRPYSARNPDGARK